MEDFKGFAVEAAQEAGTFLSSKLNSVHTIGYKGETNLVTEADTISEEMITSKIRNRFPDHDILSEESTFASKGSDFRWIIDPLDGTTNYAHGYTFFSVSIALQKLDTMLLGVIYDPTLKEMFIAAKGEGAFLNGSKIHVSHAGKIIESLIATGFPYDIGESKDNNLNYFSGMIKRAQAIRRAGSAALDLAYVAAGRFDGFWEIKLNPWDTAAGWLIVEEAGGTVTDMWGKGYTMESHMIVASNGKIHDEMVGILKDVSAT